jgi:hypothetical protein
MVLRAVVRDGRIVIDEPTSLPNGTVLDLVVDDEGDDLSDESRRALDASLATGLAEAHAGHGRDARELVAELRARRK